MTGPAVDWQEVYRRDRELSIASMTPPDWALPNATQQRGYASPSSTQNPSGNSQIGQVTRGPAEQALLAEPELIGKARFWGIPENVASSMPINQLQDIIHRNEAEAHQAADQAGGWQQFATAVASVPAMFGIGATEAILNVPRNIPIVGEYFRRNQALSYAVSQMSELEEGVRASTRSDFQWVNSLDKGAGELAGLWYPGAAAWKAAAIAGKAPALIGLGSPLLRMAAQGGAAGWLLEGGSEGQGAFGMTRAQTAVVGGAVMGAALHPVEQMLTKYAPQIAAGMDRVSKYFDGPWSRWVNKMPSPGAAAAQGANAAAEVAPAIQDAAAASRIEQLRRMATDPAATPETRQQATEMLAYMNKIPKVDMNPVPPSYGEGMSPEVAASFDRMMTAASEARARIPIEQRGMSMAEATQSADQMSKASLIIDSPAFPEAAGTTVPNDGTVAKAVGEANPGGTNIVPAVANPAEFMQQVGMNPTSMEHVRFARRPGSTQLDALLSDQPISEQMIQEYEKYGVFSGQSAQTAAGRDVTIQSIENGLATVAPLYGGAPHYVPVGDLLPSAQSAVSRPVPGLYEELGTYVQGRVAATADAFTGALDTQMLGRIRNENMPGYIEDFLDEMGVSNLGERARIRQYFNERIVEDYSTSVPEESAFQRQMEEAAAPAEMVSETPQRRLDQVAHTKGFMVVPEGATGGYRIVDMMGTPTGAVRAPTTITFEDAASAEAWLQKINRPAPDVTPASDVPVEVARTLPTQSHLEPELRNEHYQPSLEENADDITETISRTDPQLGAHVRSVVEQAKASGSLGRIHQAWEYAFSQFQPMRARWMEIAGRLNEAGLGQLRPWDDWDALTTALTKKHNWEHPWLDRWARITDHFNVKDLREGRVTQIYEIEDDALRLRKAQEAGFGPRQIAALDEMHQYFRELFPVTGLDPAREIARYISHVRARQSMGASVANAFEGYAMNPAVEPFYEMVRAGGMQLRELDARNLGNIYVRSLGFQKYMRADWDAATRKWRDIAQIEELKPLANTFMNWANLMKTGYIPGNDKTLQVAQSVLDMFMPGITRAQTAKIFNQGLSVTHLALLGYRPDVMARDSIQLLLALPRAKSDLVAVMRDMATGGAEVRQQMFDRGLEAGTVVLGKPRIAGSGVFEPHMAGVVPGTADNGMQLGMEGINLVEQEGPRGPLYKALQATTDALHDLVPDSMRHLEGSKLHPLYFYTKQSEQMRMVVGEAGIRRASRAIAEYRAAGEAGSLDQLMGDSMARTFDPSVQQKFKDFIASGNDKEAANFLARQLTDATMFRYGMVENPEFARDTFGKMGMQMGNFSTQFYQYAKESVRNGTFTDKAAFWAMMGGVAAGLKAAEKATGWGFSKWQFYNSLTFTGGPWISNFMDAQTAASNASRIAYMDEDQAGGDSQIRTAVDATHALGRGVGQMLNPLSGLQRTARGIGEALDSPQQGNAFARLFITGEFGNSLYNRQMETEAFGPAIPQAPPQLSPYSNPVSGARTGQPLPPTVAPPNPVNPLVGTGMQPGPLLRKITGGGAQF